MSPVVYTCLIFDVDITYDIPATSSYSQPCVGWIVDILPALVTLSYPFSYLSQSQTKDILSRPNVGRPCGVGRDAIWSVLVLPKWTRQWEEKYATTEVLSVFVQDSVYGGALILQQNEKILQQHLLVLYPSSYPTSEFVQRDPSKSTNSLKILSIDRP